MNVYIDSENFSTATTVYLDSLLTEVAPDGYYSDNINYRRQLDGILTDVASCASVGKVACYRVRGGLNITPCTDGFDAFAAIGSNTFVVGDIVQYVRTADMDNVICGEIMSTTEFEAPDSYIYSPTAVDVCGNPTFCNIPNPG